MNPGKPPSHDWRAHPPTRSVYAREWRGTGSSSSSWLTRKFKLRLVGFGLVVLVSLIAILLVSTTNTNAQTQLLTFGIGAYGGQTNPRGIVPINPFGEQDAGAFQVLNDRNPSQFLPIRQEVNALNGDQFLEFWGKERSSDKLARQNLIVFCTMHGSVQPSGEVELFAIDATPESRGKMIPLKNLIALLQESPARHVLLVLDSSRLGSSWRLGILSNDIAEQIASDWPARSHNRNVPSGPDANKVAVLLAASPGQQSWPMEGQSAFAHFLIEGLLGAADGWEKTDGPSRNSGRDQRVSLYELTAYARQQIEDWTRQRYGSTQSIQLLGNDTDFEIARVSSPIFKADRTVSKLAAEVGKQKSPDAVAGEGKTSTDETKSAPTAPPEIRWDARLAKELWKTRDQWRDETGKIRPAVRRQSPLAWRAFEANLALAEALRRGGQEKLGVTALQQADAVCRRLNEQSTSLAGLNWTPKESQLLQSWGFSFDANSPPRDAIAAAGKFLLAGLVNSTASDSTVNPAKNLPEPDSMAIRTWLIQELQRESTAENWARLRQIIERIPATPDLLFLRDVLATMKGETQIGAGDVLPQFFELRDRFRGLAVRVPESWPLVTDDIRSGLRSLNAAERWLLATDASRPEIKDWLRKAAEAVTKAEQTAGRYSEAIGIWGDLLSELPSIAEWVATRANDDDQRSLDWLSAVASQWAQREQDGRWDVGALLSSWPEKPKRLTDVERKLLTQFVDAQQLKRALFASIEKRVSADDLAKLVSEATAHRRDFWQEFPLFFSPLEIANPPPSAWRESYRLLDQPWVPLEERIKFDKLQQEIESRVVRSNANAEELGKRRPLTSAGEILPDRSATTGAVWQGFWAVASLSLLTQSPGETSDLWKDWERLVERSPLPPNSRSSSDTERSDLRKRRAELGQKIREQWTRVPIDAPNLPTIRLLAAMLEPFLIPEKDPDDLIRDERQRQLVAWLTLFSEDWRSRATNSANSNSLAYAELAQKSDELARGLGRGRDLADTPPGTRRTTSPRLLDVGRLSFNAERQGKLILSTSTNDEASPASRILISGRGVRLMEGTNPISVDRGVLRPLPENGKFSADLRLDDSIETAQTMLVVLTEPDGFPLDFRLVFLHPPFDPAQWRIEFSEATSQTPLETEPLSRSTGVKVYLPPSASVSLRANLIRPKKDGTPSAKIAIYRLADSSQASREILGEVFDLKLEPGTIRTPIVCDVPVSPKEKPIGKEVVASGPIEDLGRGWLFQITPEGQPTFDYAIRPTFYSAVNFINDPKPTISDGRLTLALKRPAVSKEQEGLLPKKIVVELHVPDSLRRTLTDYTLSGSVEIGQPLTLSFALPKNWSDLARSRRLILNLDVAGLPHAYIWRIEPSGDVTPISGQPPHVEIRLLQPSPEGKNPPRLKPVILSGKDSLSLQFQVNATELDRTDAVGDWALKYTVNRESATGVEPTPLQKTWQMFSSLQRHVFLQNIRGGVWSIQTQAVDYMQEVPEAEIRGLSGRFQVRADLMRANQPNALATETFRFAIDDDKPPDVKIVWPSSGSKMIDKDRSFQIDKDLTFQIEATDLESGIQRIAYGFDLNGDELLQESKELLDENIQDKSGVNLDDTKVTWGVRIGKTRLPKLANDKDKETKFLIVQTQNGLGIVKTHVEPVTLRKPAATAASLKATTGTLVVNLKVNRGANSTVHITGPDTRSERNVKESVTFADLKPGRYEIKVEVNYAVVGTKAAGGDAADVKAGDTTTAEVSTSASK